MTGRPSVNKRQRELMRKERQAEKLTRRDERRVKRNLPEEEEPPAATAPADVGAVPEPVAVDSPSVK